MRILRYVKLLPLLVIVAMLSFAVRVGDFMGALQRSGAALAQEEVHADAPPLPAKPGDQGPADGELVKTDESKEIRLPALPAVEGEAASGSEIQGEVAKSDSSGEQSWQDGGDAAFENSEVQASLYKDLVDRRKKLDQREKELIMREALLEAGERELDQKLREMMAIRNDIEGLLQEQSAEEKARVESLVKIYEGMKAKDAAGIFNTLDMDVLIRIMARMSERKSAPILAEMNPERARTVTILLAQQRQLPALAAGQ